MPSVDPQQLQNLAVSAFVVLLMVSVGLDLSLDRVVGCIRRPLGLLSGLLVQYLLVPAVAVALAAALDLQPAARAGLLLCAVAPGGPMGAFLALQAGGDVALAAAVVILANVLNTVLVPVGLEVLGVPVGPMDQAHILPMAQTIVLYQVLPLVFGLVLRRVLPDQAARLQRATAFVANALLLVFSVAIVVAQGSHLLEAGVGAILAVEGTVLASFLLGWLVSPPDREARVALATTGVIHSTSACVLLASTWFPDPGTLLVVFVYSGCMFVTGMAGTRLLARTRPRPSPASSAGH